MGFLLWLSSSHQSYSFRVILGKTWYFRLWLSFKVRSEPEDEDWVLLKRQDRHSEWEEKSIIQFFSWFQVACLQVTSLVYPAACTSVLSGLPCLGCLKLDDWQGRIQKSLNFFALSGTQVVTMYIHLSVQHKLSSFSHRSILGLSRLI